MSTKLTICSLLLGTVTLALPALADELKVGDKVPDFSLVGSDGKTYKLSDFDGKQTIVIAWFPKAKTKGCTLECKSMREHGKLLRAFDVAYFTASCDEPQLNKEFAEMVQADYPILSDTDQKLAKALGVFDDTRKVARRWTYYIGPDGKILFIDKEVKTPTHGKDVAAKLKELGVAEKKKS